MAIQKSFFQVCLDLEFQARFHWHVEDLGMQHRYIKARTPQLNGKVERSHRTDQDEFYQLLTHKDDVDLEEKLNAWENFYNFERPHQSHAGKTPYEVMKCLLALKANTPVGIEVPQRVQPGNLMGNGVSTLRMKYLNITHLNFTDNQLDQTVAVLKKLLKR